MLEKHEEFEIHAPYFENYLNKLFDPTDEKTRILLNV